MLLLQLFLFFLLHMQVCDKTLWSAMSVKYEDVRLVLN